MATAYLIGSIPSAYLVTRWLTGRDIRQLGDGNSGAANVFRSVGNRAGIFVGVADIGKGAVAVLLVRGVLDSNAAAMLAGVVVVAGHNWPIHLQWRGGRGAATAVGVLLVMLPLIAIPLSLVALVFLYLARSSIRVLAFLFISIALLSWPAGYSFPIVLYSVGIPVLVGTSHYLSVRRNGSQEEPAGGEQVLPQG